MPLPESRSAQKILRDATRAFLKKKKIHPAQKALMEKAGFKLRYISRDGIVNWRRGPEITISLRYNRPLSIKKLVERVVAQTNYWAKRKTTINPGEARLD